MISNLLNQLQLNYPNSNIYLYGSHVYNTNSELSDYDFIIVGDFDSHGVKTENGDLNFYSKEDFNKLLISQEISALECLFLEEKYKRESFKLEWSLNLENLRTSCSQKSSNSWVKAKKKLLVENESYIAQKSLFHSLRILNFANQIATQGIISDYNSKDLWEEIYKAPLNWDTWMTRFKTRYNHLKTEFKKNAPK